MTPHFCNHVVARYTIAFISTATAAWGRSLLQPTLGAECPFSLFYLSVLLTAWIAGAGPALLSLLLGTAAAIFFFVAAHSSFIVQSPDDLVSLAIYVVVNCVAIGLFSSSDRQRQLAEARLKDNERLTSSLREADHRKDEFLALLAHELRNPLAPIKTSLTIWEKTGSVREETRQVMVRQMVHLVRLVDDLMDVSRLLRGNVQLKVAVVDLRDAVRDAVEQTQEWMEQKSHNFHCVVPNKGVFVQGDIVRLTQLTANLLSNAAKYTPKSGRITLNLEAIGETARLSVTDNGIGIPPSESKRIFEPFTQIDTSRTREYGGLGVGLSIVKSLVEMHQGTLVAVSRGAGTGSCFTVTFPLAAELPSDPPADGLENVLAVAIRPGRPKGSYRLLSAAEGSQSSARTKCDPVLIVEDNVDAGQSLRELMRLHDIDADVVHEGPLALQAVDRKGYNTVVLDIGLPGMDGFEVARQLRRRCEGAQPRIIALTGWGGEEHRRLSEEAGFDAHVVKPVCFPELLAQIHGEEYSPSPRSGDAAQIVAAL